MELDDRIRASIARVIRLATLAAPLNYFVLYETNDSPLPSPEQVSSLDSGRAAALPGLLFALQLPRHRQDSADASFGHLVETRQLEMRPRIHLLPFDRFERVRVEALAGEHRTLAIGPPDRQAQLTVLCGELEFMLPPLADDALTSELLRKTWDSIAEAMAPDETRRTSHHVMATFDSAAADVPNGFLTYQLADHVLPAGTRTAKERVEQAFHIRTLISAMAQLESAGASLESAERDFPDEYRLQRDLTRLPVAWGAPGVSPSEERAVAQRLSFSRSSIRGLDRRHDSEHKAVSVLTTSAAVRRTGVGITSDAIPGAAFVALSNIERHWTSGPKPQKMRRLMRQLNEAAASIWSEDVRVAIARASDLTTFSNFPLGLLTFPGDSAPLAYRLPITHRPLSSLTAALEYEFGNTPRADLSRGFRVLVAECLSPTDPVGHHSRIGWSEAETMLNESPADVDLIRVDVTSADQLSAAIEDHSPDVLVISAHGTERGGVAGVQVGRDFYAADRRRDWPPFVILSACRVAPRGAGGPNIADRILEQGAVAVLATEVDVDVRHNSLLCVRLFLYMALAIEGKQPESDLLAVWHRVQGSSPITDVMHAGGPLGRWMRGNGTAPPPFVRFMNESARGALRRAHAFEDTERFLLRLAAEEGEELALAQWLVDPGYVPESAFYSMAGFPENVLFQGRQVLSVSNNSVRRVAPRRGLLGDNGD